ncbi:MAG: ABC transporter ATP-binding protein [Planctomycetaceae bacterium]|nr:ABC transporter ATP-binding protein [Planctomycetaceae bacterium]
MSDPALVVEGVSFRYGDRQALNRVTFEVQPGEIFGLLGPNGGGKTTLFRILSTTLPVQEGKASLAGLDVASSPDAVRRIIGVTFQSPSIDPKLTVGENLTYQGHLYGLKGGTLKHRTKELLKRLGLSDRRSDIAEKLSGGLKRRVEIAKSLLHEPRILLLDEPSTGLDPGARHDLWRYLSQLRDESGVTVMVTTHLMEEAERCDRLGLLSKGELVALGTPDDLRSSVGGDCITVQPAVPESDLATRIRERFNVEVQEVDGAVRVEREQGHELVRDLVAAFPNDVKSVAFGKPTLEDVFIRKTGHRFWDEETSDEK